VGHWRGSKKGARHVGGYRGREIRRRAQVRTRRSTVGAGRADLTGQAHGAERGKGTRGATAQQLANRAREAEREEGSAGGETGADRSAPLARRAREGGRAGARPGWAELGRLGCWAAFLFSFSLDFLIPFPFLFYRVFKSRFKLGFKFK
jgi:hypothetical protein